MINCTADDLDFDDLDFDDDTFDHDDACDCDHCIDRQLSDCGYVGNGDCTNAGSEYCDFECRIKDI